MEAPKPKGFGEFDDLMRNLVKLPPGAGRKCVDCGSENVVDADLCPDCNEYVCKECANDHYSFGTCGKS